jgi:hypothetical protein
MGYATRFMLDILVTLFESEKAVIYRKIDQQGIWRNNVDIDAFRVYGDWGAKVR